MNNEPKPANSYTPRPAHECLGFPSRVRALTVAALAAGAVIALSKGEPTLAQDTPPPNAELHTGISSAPISLSPFVPAQTPSFGAFSPLPPPDLNFSMPPTPAVPLLFPAEVPDPLSLSPAPFAYVMPSVARIDSSEPRLTSKAEGVDIFQYECRDDRGYPYIQASYASFKEEFEARYLSLPDNAKCCVCLAEVCYREADQADDKETKDALLDIAQGLGLAAVSLTPIASEAMSLYEIVYGHNIYGENVSVEQRAFDVVMLAVGVHLDWERFGVPIIAEVHEFGTIEAKTADEGIKLLKEIGSADVDGLKGPTLPASVARTFERSQYENIRAAADTRLYRYFGYDNRLHKEFVYFTDELFEDIFAARERLGIKPEWTPDLIYRSEFVVPEGTWLSVGTAAEVNPVLKGGGRQIVIVGAPTRAWKVGTKIIQH